MKESRPRNIRPDRPLQCSCEVRAWASEPRALGPFWRAMALAAAWLPAHGSTRSALTGARAFKMVVGGAGAYLALALRTPSGLALGAALAASTLFLPLARHRRDGLVANMLRRAEPRQKASWSQADLSFDGDKLTITQGGRVWKSARWRQGEHELVVGQHGERALVGFVHKHRGRARALWLQRVGGDAISNLRPLQSELLAGAEDAARVPAPAWDALVSHTGALPAVSR